MSVLKTRPMIRTAIITFAVLVLTSAYQPPAHADEFEPLCSEVDGNRGGCWSVLANHPGCHYRSPTRPYHWTGPVTWSGSCVDERAAGAGVLEDAEGNRAEGQFVEGLKDGRWVRHLATGTVNEETFEHGLWAGQWTYTWANGKSEEGWFENGYQAGVWETNWPDGYSETGLFQSGKKQGVWTITWPDGVEALVPYVDGVIHGEVTVRRPEGALGTLIYWKGKHVDGVLKPVLIGEPIDP